MISHETSFISRSCRAQMALGQAVWRGHCLPAEPWVGLSLGPCSWAADEAGSAKSMHDNLGAGIPAHGKEDGEGGPALSPGWGRGLGEPPAGLCYAHHSKSPLRLLIPPPTTSQRCSPGRTPIRQALLPTCGPCEVRCECPGAASLNARKPSPLLHAAH